MNPFELSGPNFLMLFGVFVALVFAAGFLLRWLGRVPSDDQGVEIDGLSPNQIACLQGGKRAAINAALASLLHRGYVKVDSSTGEISALEVGNRPANGDSLERKIYREIESKKIRSIKDIPNTAPTTLDQLRQSLDRQGLTVSEDQAWVTCGFPLLLIVSAAAIGAIKIFIGLHRDRPVVLLTLAVVVTVVAGLIAFCRLPLRSRRGDRVLQRLREEHKTLETAARYHAEGLSTTDVALASALFGVGILTFGPFADWHTAMHSHAVSHGGGWAGGDGCGDGGGGGGGDGGCGGGGCGGCGGCGG